VAKKGFADQPSPHGAQPLSSAMLVLVQVSSMKTSLAGSLPMRYFSPVRVGGRHRGQCMSYDLMVFDPAAAPSSKPEFLTWYEQQTEWTEGHSYDDPAVTTPKLRLWYQTMIADFPPMNGPHRSDDFDDPRVSDYSVGQSVIYVAFSWSQAELAYEAVRRAAEVAGVGFFDASGADAEIWLPGQKAAAKPGFWRRLLGLS
jgi:hypothetical protein